MPQHDEKVMMSFTRPSKKTVQINLMKQDYIKNKNYYKSIIHHLKGKIGGFSNEG